MSEWNPMNANEEAKAAQSVEEKELTDVVNQNEAQTVLETLDPTESSPIPEVTEEVDDITPVEEEASKVVEEVPAEPKATSFPPLADDLSQSQLSFDQQVIQKITVLAIREVEGVMLDQSGSGLFNFKGNKGIGINMNDDKTVSVTLDIILEYGKSAPEAFAELKQRVGSAIKTMTGLTVKDVNVKIANVLTSEEFRGNKR